MHSASKAWPHLSSLYFAPVLKSSKQIEQLLSFVLPSSHIFERILLIYVCVNPRFTLPPLFSCSASSYSWVILSTSGLLGSEVAACFDSSIALYKSLSSSSAADVIPCGMLPAIACIIMLLSATLDSISFIAMAICIWRKLSRIALACSISRFYSSASLLLVLFALACAALLAFSYYISRFNSSFSFFIFRFSSFIVFADWFLASN